MNNTNGQISRMFFCRLMEIRGIRLMRIVRDQDLRLRFGLPAAILPEGRGELGRAAGASAEAGGGT